MVFCSSTRPSHHRASRWGWQRPLVPNWVAVRHGLLSEQEFYGFNYMTFGSALIVASPFCSELEESTTQLEWVESQSLRRRSRSLLVAEAGVDGIAV